MGLEKIKAYKFLYTCASELDDFTDYVTVEICRHFREEFDAVHSALSYESKFNAVNLEVLTIMVYEVNSPCNILLNIERNETKGE